MYNEEMRKFKRKIFFRDLFSLIFIVGLFGLCLYVTLKLLPKPYTFTDRQEQINQWR